MDSHSRLRPFRAPQPVPCSMTLRLPFSAPCTHDHGSDGVPTIVAPMSVLRVLGVSIAPVTGPCLHSHPCSPSALLVGSLAMPMSHHAFACHCHRGCATDHTPGLCDTCSSDRLRSHPLDRFHLSRGSRMVLCLLQQGKACPDVDHDQHVPVLCFCDRFVLPCDVHRVGRALPSRVTRSLPGKTPRRTTTCTIRVKSRAMSSCLHVLMVSAIQWGVSGPCCFFVVCAASARVVRPSAHWCIWKTHHLHPGEITKEDARTLMH